VVGRSAVKPLLVFGYGNPGRGDDGLGPAFVEAVERTGLAEVECLTDMQLQVEHVMDMQGRSLVLFVDADMSCHTPFSFDELQACMDESYTSHAMAPQALMYAYRKVLDEAPPAVFLLRIKGESFELGETLSAAALSHLELSLTQFETLSKDISPQGWRKWT
jgi:hydrogenase maturation protease